jgi:hypothetical protein
MTAEEYLPAILQTSRGTNLSDIKLNLDSALKCQLQIGIASCSLHVIKNPTRVDVVIGMRVSK